MIVLLQFQTLSGKDLNLTKWSLQFCITLLSDQQRSLIMTPNETF